jgi:hypothetical protein
MQLKHTVTQTKIKITENSDNNIWNFFHKQGLWGMALKGLVNST